MVKKLLIGSAVYFSIVGATVTENELSKKDKETLNKLEINATCGCLLHWEQVDLEEGRIDSMVFNSYTWNIKEIKQRNNE